MLRKGLVIFTGPFLFFCPRDKTKFIGRLVAKRDINMLSYEMIV